MNKTMISAAALAAILGVAAITAVASAEDAAAPAAAAAAATEKCYGVVKAGQNECKSADGAHSCQGQGAADGSATDWLNVPAGLCAKLAHGSTEAPTKK